MRKPLIAGNWKMFKTTSGARALLDDLRSKTLNGIRAEIAVCPPYPYLALAAERLRGTKIALGAQNCHWENEGAFTGEVAPPMLQDIGCEFCIVGHSERRQLFGETDEGVNRKIRALHTNGLTPIACVGETLEQREADETLAVIERQARAAFANVSPAHAATTVVAYEPVWAIGTGKNATPEQAQEVHAALRALLAGMYSETIAQGMRILYGGSVKPDNAKDLMAQTDIDGALVGGASLKSADFFGIAEAAPSK